MIYTLKNSELTVRISDMGAEILSMADAKGEEYIWQGDAAFWGDHSPVLFPYCGRVWNSLCTVEGVPCSLGLHGFFMHMKTDGEQISDTEVSFALRESAETLAQYPFAFEMKMTYILRGNTLVVRVEVKNTGNRTLPYGYGVHPGFRIPAEQAEQFYLEFAEKNRTKALCLDASECYPVGGECDFPMQNGNRFYLPRGDLSAVLRERAGAVVIAGDASDHRITLRYPDFDYLTLWRPAGGPFVCVEPWTSVPSTFGERTELTAKADLVHLPAGESAVHEFEITVE